MKDGEGVSDEGSVDKWVRKEGSQRAMGCRKRRMDGLRKVLI